ncbi:MAG: hypothetical protein P0Y56_12890 [Candidatus Andeanibacterium colombiense]|uniref:Uncharacterized protein n=1 Tax=Candidatus Andeanibacterium colombiense TaxID=3121345 RepID=A0AAJ5X5D6_9SPHN|nr:MAG: hypothetical protein P0Y56_12890 [Sphingomonadaceae bacterium]
MRVALGALALVLAATPAAAQLGKVTQSAPPAGVSKGQGSANPKGHYAELDALPDWGGIWFAQFRPNAGGGDAGNGPPKLKGEYKARYDAYVAEVKANNGMVKQTRSNCSPPGMPVIMQTFQYPFEFIFAPGRVTVNQEAWMQTRTIWTDGRSHQDDPDPTFMGDSVGHWEGDTLVAETIAIDDALDLQRGMSHSAGLTITERIHLDPSDPNVLLNEMTLDDPAALEEPYHLTIRYGRDRYGQLLEFQCSQNDRNEVDENGETAPF